MARIGRGIWRAACLAAALAFAPTAAPAVDHGAATAAARIVAVGPELAGDSQATRLTFVVSGKVEAHSFVLERPDRVVVDLPAINFQFGADAGRTGRGLVRSYRYGLFGLGRSRIVIELGQPAVVKAISLGDEVPGGARPLTIELVRTDRAGLARAVEASRQTAEGLKARAFMPPPAAANDAKRVVVLDPGHGGVDPGANGRNGLLEKDIVFAFAASLRDRLVATGRYRVLLTRNEDVFVSLGDRVRFSREAKAELFVSIHADTLGGFEKVRGATVYTGSAKASDAQAARLAEDENRSDEAAGLEGKDETQDAVADILSDFARRETRALSHVAARRMVTGIEGPFTLNKNPLRSAGFRVLTAPDVPSVLLEIGYLSSPADAELMASEAWKDKAAAAVAASIDAFFAQKQAAGTGLATGIGIGLK